ncbi:hypothetical protein [Brucella anthropi]|uniref:hypothetical protein n=1 Tax=Brucella anthropi TaxID=529 RepID=UPI0005C2CE8C|nr:hypothetical protein [Brucella anthropi]KIU70142.1 hypothetical protein TR92_02340 [Brucella anthropi]
MSDEFSDDPQAPKNERRPKKPRKAETQELDPLLLKLVSVFAKADAIEDHELWLKGLPPLKADAPLQTKKRSRKEGDAKVEVNWHSIPQDKRTRP